MTDQEKNRYTKRRLEIKRRRERRRMIVTGACYLSLTVIMACGIGLFCRHLLLNRPVKEAHAMAATAESIEATLVLADATTETETEAAPRWSDDELSALQLIYSGFVHGRGWNMPHRDNNFCMAAKGEYLTAMQVRVQNQTEGMTGTIEYSVNVSGRGWLEWTGNGGAAGATDSDQPVEAIRARFTGELGEYYDIYYSVLQDNSWSEWVKNGTEAGVSAAGKRVEGLRVSSIKKTDSETVFPGGVDPSKPMIALTFDDGPNRATTGKILDVLEQYDSRATFFMVGSRIDGQHDVVRRMQEQGNEVANHTMNHIPMNKASTTAFAEQMILTNRAVTEACGVSPVLMRPPEGAVNDSGMAAIGSVGMSAVLWTLDTRDWRSRNAEAITEAVLTQVKDGDIVLLHDLYEPTAEAVEAIVPVLIDQGYQLVTVSELASYRGGILPGGKYGSFR